MTDLDELSAQISQLEARLGPATGMIASFDSELAQMGRTLSVTGREVEGMSRSFGSGLRRAFDGIVFDGARLSDAMRQLGQSISNTLYNAAMRPVQNALGGAMSAGLAGIMTNAIPFAQWRLQPGTRHAFCKRWDRIRPRHISDAWRCRAHGGGRA